MVALACLVMAAVFVVAGWRQASGRTGRRETTSLVLVAGLIPPLVVTGVILSGAGRMGDVRLALEAVSVGTDTLDRAGFTIGGDPARDGVVVPGLHAGAVRVTRTPEGAARLTFRRPAAGAPVAGVASIDGGRSFLGAVEIADGDPVGAAGRRLVRQGDHLLGAQGEAGRALKGSGTGPSALFPLAYHAPEAAPAGGDWDFFYWRRGALPLTRRLEFVALSAETPAPETAAAGAAVSAIDLAPGQTASLALYALDFTEPWRLDAPGGGRPSRAVERRSLRVEWAGERLLLRFDTPERITLKAARLESLTSSGGGRPGLEIFFGPDPGAVGDAQGVVTFDTLGEGVRAQLTRRLTLASDSATYAVSGGATEAPRFGEAFEVGGDARAQIRVSRLDLGWRAFAGLFGAVWAGALAALAAGLAWRRGSIAGLVVMGVVECLLALRLLFAVEGAYVDWRPDAAAAAPQAMFAFVLVPFILTMAFAPRATLDRRLTLAYVALAAILTALMFMVVRAADPVGLVLSAIGVLAVASRLLPAPAAPEPLVRWFDGALSRCADGLGALRARLLPGGDAPQAAAGRRTTAILLAVVALVVGRVLLALGGVEQRLPFGGAVSLLWTPALLILTAVLLAQRLAAPAGSVASEGRGAVWLWGVVVLLAAVVPWLVADDLGYAIHLLPLVFVAALLAFAEPTAGGRWRKALLAGPAVAIVVALAGIAIAASIRGPEPSDWAAITDSRSPEAHALLQRYAEEEAAALRMGQSLRREIDAPSGSRQAEEMAAAFHHMRAYGSTVWGRGFLSLDTPTELLRYHLDDNVSVVHLISPHGRMAAIGLLAMLWAAAGCCTALAAAGGRRPGAGPLAGLLAMWTLALVAAYMILANLQITPFTGRNLYLLSPASISDLLEGLTLAAIALITLGPRRDA